MENILFAAGAVFPLFVMVMIGQGLGKSGWFDPEYVKKTNRFVFKICLPVMLFRSIQQNEISLTENLRLILFAEAALLVLVVLSVALVPLFVRQNARRSVLMQMIWRTNCLIFGLPVAINIFGEAGAAPMALIMAAVIPMFNIYSVIILAVFDVKNEGHIEIGKTLLSIVKNPLIIASLLGLAASLADIRFPAMIDTALTYLANIASPLALICLGANLTVREGRPPKGILICGLLLRLVLVPVAAMTAAVLFGFRGAELGALLLLFASPMAVTGYVMSAEAGADAALAARYVFYSTLLVCLSMFFFILIFRNFGLI
ncbi:MAG: AEC family transporter [Clostridia bacterium]|nr:AEC family transporter [Clostridia bacterium]